MRDLLVLVTLLVLGFSITTFAGVGLDQWLVATHPVDETADVRSGILPVGTDRYLPKTVSAR